MILSIDKLMTLFNTVGQYTQNPNEWLRNLSSDQNPKSVNNKILELRMKKLYPIIREDKSFVVVGETESYTRFGVHQTCYASTLGLHFYTREWKNGTYLYTRLDENVKVISYDMWVAEQQARQESLKDLAVYYMVNTHDDTFERFGAYECNVYKDNEGSYYKKSYQPSQQIFKYEKIDNVEGYVFLTEDEFIEKAKERELSLHEVTEVSEKAFEHAQDCLPPCGLTYFNQGKLFYVSERLCGNTVSWFVKLGKKFYEVVNFATLANDDVLNLVEQFNND
ncbi:hypothetical protein A1QO_04210 [Vibrio genomosp. F10 str. ZF-129]|uniref:Uncharacterized protein n=1 Tax=Vibrio genomosp. F10 str. ZF-129 TaxID=1187848 RepID=A0A1E5BIQ4_9VIBR|nr:hypothetical protein [Vibrio genomosp. F10]OEE37316.1 hypothetical protein A1QO_04210 [Vibrio genomosp. F10 str. ZF-129]